MFIKQEEKFVYMDGKCDNILEKLEPAVYDVHKIDTFFGPKIWFEQNNTFKSGAELNSGFYKEAKEHCKDFFSPEMRQLNTALKFRQKLGLTFNGIPGSGRVLKKYTY